MPSLLLVLSAADHWTLADGRRHPTGFWAEELIEPMRVFRDAGVDVTIATPGGVSPTVDEASLSDAAAGGEERAAGFRRELDALADQLASPATLAGLSPDDYDGVFVPGGHGPMEDLASSPELGRLLQTMVDDGKVVGAVCHGPAAMLSATRPDGTWAFAGRRMTGFTNDEEAQGGLAGVEAHNRKKAAVLYDYLDATEFYASPVAPEDRSLMNVPFKLHDEALNDAFLKGAQERHMLQLKGHRSVGGMRASIYNAMPIEGVQALVAYMKEFEASHG